MTSLDLINQSKNKYYPLKTETEKDSILAKKITNKSKKIKNKNKLELNLAQINISTKESFDMPKTQTKNSSPIKLPILNCNMSAYTKMKQYKVFPLRHRDKKEVSVEEEEKKVKKLLNKYANSTNKKNKHLISDDISKKYNFDRYLKLQSDAEIQFKPRIGDSSNLLVNYIKKVSKIRKQMVGDVLDEINHAENRYNLEKPKVDFNFRSKDKILIDNRWKNTFSLDEYQKYFSRNLKGKISSMSYLKMMKKFQKISLICFSEGNLNHSAIKKLDKMQ